MPIKKMQFSTASQLFSIKHHCILVSMVTCELFCGLNGRQKPRCHSRRERLCVHKTVSSVDQLTTEVTLITVENDFSLF